MNRLLRVISCLFLFANQPLWCGDYQEINKEKYEEMLKKIKNLDFSKIVTYEKVDEGDLKKELACVAGLCEI